MKKILILIPLILILFNCGTVLDTSKVVAKWDLASVEYYAYNSELDSYKKISGTNSSTPTADQPTNSAFFWINDSGVMLEFLSNNQFYVASNSNPKIVDATKTN